MYNFRRQKKNEQLAVVSEIDGLAHLAAILKNDVTADGRVSVSSDGNRAHAEIGENEDAKAD